MMANAFPSHSGTMSTRPDRARRAAHGAAAPVARALALPEPAEAWERLGFAPGGPIGDVAVALGAPALELAVSGLEAERPDGLPLVATDAGPAGHARHPNGATVVDHVVALTDDMARTLAALGDAGLELRRMREPPEAPASQAFFNLRTLVLEVVEVKGDGPALWGLTVVVGDLDALGPLVEAPRSAVQPGRRIATVRKEVGLRTALAFMTPRPHRSRPS